MRPMFHPNRRGARCCQAAPRAVGCWQGQPRWRRQPLPRRAAAPSPPRASAGKAAAPRSGDGAFRPDLLAGVHARYGRPVLLAETSIEGERRADWLRHVGRCVSTKLPR